MKKLLLILIGVLITLPALARNYINESIPDAPLVKAGKTILKTGTMYTIYEPVEITITCGTEGAEIYYLLRNLEGPEIMPSHSDYTLYTEPIELDDSKQLWVYTKSGEKCSKDYGYLIQIDRSIPYAPVVKAGETVLKPGNLYESNEPVEVTITCDTEDAKIYYMLFNSDATVIPNHSEYTLYTEPLQLTDSTHLWVYSELNGKCSNDSVYDIEISESGISAVAADAENAEYYTPEGVRVMRPERGRLYIIRAGGKVFKAIVN